jgi:ferrous iron transport protein A
MKRRLADVKSGHVVVSGIDGGHGINSHLAGMRIVSGMSLDVIRNDGDKGPIVVRVQNTRIALGRKMANKILVVEEGA